MAMGREVREMEYHQSSQQLVCRENKNQEIFRRTLIFNSDHSAHI